MSQSEYVVAAYGVVFVTLLVYVAIIAAKLSRLERDTAELAELARRRASEMAEFLVVPALLAYGEAAFAYAGELRGPGLAGRLATWGVRLGWLAQTALLVGQAAVGRRVSVGDLGRRAQPLRLARRRRVPDLGLHAPLPAARPDRDARRRRAARARLGGRRDRASTRATAPASSWRCMSS